MVFDSLDRRQNIPEEITCFLRGQHGELLLETSAIFGVHDKNIIKDKLANSCKNGRARGDANRMRRNYPYDYGYGYNHCVPCFGQTSRSRFRSRFSITATNGYKCIELIAAWKLDGMHAKSDVPGTSSGDTKFRLLASPCKYAANGLETP